MKLPWLIASFTSVVHGAVFRSGQQSSLSSQEELQQISLPASTISKLEAVKDALHLKGAGYVDVVDWLLEHAGTQVNEKALASTSSENLVAARLNTSTALGEKAAAQKQTCLFDDQMFGMNPQMKTALQQELTSGPLADAVHYVRNHPNEGWMHCAYGGQACSCTGKVRFGEFSWLGPTWSEPVAAAGSVTCSAAQFHFTITNKDASTACQCAWDTEKHQQNSIQLHFNSWSYAQEAWIFLLRTLAQAKWMPFSGDRNFHGSTLFGARGGGVFDRVWINKWLGTVGQEYVQKYLGKKQLNCLEWDPIFYTNQFPACAQAGYNLWYKSDPAEMRVEGKTIYADILKLPKVAGDLKMDLVISTQVWEHLNQPVPSLKALYESMSPGGVLLFAVPFKAPFHGAPEDYWRYTKSGVVQVLEQGGFCVPRSAMASGGDFIYSIGLNAGISAGDFSQEELLAAYFRGFDAIPDGPLEIFAVGLKKRTPTDVCPP